MKSARNIGWQVDDDANGRAVREGGRRPVV